MRRFLSFHDSASGATNDSLDALARGRHVDPARMAPYLCLDVGTNPDDTLYPTISGALRSDAWQLGSSEPAARVRSLREAIATVRAALLDSIRASVGDSTRVAVQASGGIDSAVVLALTLEVMRERGGTAFAVAMDFASPGDDRPHLEALVGRLGCEVVRMSPAAGAAQLERTKGGIDGAPAVWSFTATELALRHVAKNAGADRILTGLGGDELFDGEPQSYATMLWKSPVRALRSARTVRGFGSTRRPAFDYVVRPHLARLAPRRLRLWRALGRTLSNAAPPWASPLLRATAQRSARRMLEITVGPPSARKHQASFELPWNRFMAWMLHQEQRTDILDRYDPLYTVQMTRLLASMPEHFLLAGNQRRGLLREVARGMVPDSLLDRDDKAGFAPAFATFVAACGGPRAFAEELEAKTLGKLDLVDPNMFRSTAKRVLASPDDEGLHALAWAAMATESFLLRNPERV